MNKFIGLARIGRDAETRYTPNGHAVANFPAAVDVGYGENKSTLWLDCALFGKRAEGGLIPYLTKGAQVVIEGEINLRQFQKQDGTHGAAVTLKVADLSLVGGKPDGQQAQPPQQRTQQAQRPQPAGQPNQGQGQQQTGNQMPEPVTDFDSDIPF